MSRTSLDIQFCSLGSIANIQNIDIYFKITKTQCFGATAALQLLGLLGQASVTIFQHFTGSRLICFRASSTKFSAYLSILAYPKARKRGWSESITSSWWDIHLRTMSILFPNPFSTGCTATAFITYAPRLCRIATYPRCFHLGAIFMLLDFNPGALLISSSSSSSSRVCPASCGRLLGRLWQSVACLGFLCQEEYAGVFRS